MRALWAAELQSIPRATSILRAPQTSSSPAAAARLTSPFSTLTSFVWISRPDHHCHSADLHLHRDAHGTDAFVAKLNPNTTAGSQLIWSTYFGGGQGDTAPASPWTQVRLTSTLPARPIHLTSKSLPVLRHISSV